MWNSVFILEVIQGSFLLDGLRGASLLLESTAELICTVDRLGFYELEPKSPAHSQCSASHSIIRQSSYKQQQCHV